MCLLDSTPDEWVPTHVWEVTKVAHREAFDELVQAVGNAGSTDDQSISEEDLKNIWPFDMRLLHQTLIISVLAKFQRR